MVGTTFLIGSYRRDSDFFSGDRNSNLLFAYSITIMKKLRIIAHLKKPNIAPKSLFSQPNKIKCKNLSSNRAIMATNIITAIKMITYASDKHCFADNVNHSCIAGDRSEAYVCAKVMPNINPIKTDNERINPLIRPLTIPHTRGIAKNKSK